MTLKGQFVLLAGSAHQNTPSETLSKVHDLVRASVRAIINAEGGIVVFTGAPEPTSPTGDSLIFDWSALREIEKISVQGRVAVIAVTSSKVRARMTTEQSALLDRLVTSGVARLAMVPDDIHTGGNIVEPQVEAASAMIAFGGGRGVFDRANRMMKKGGVVLPFEAKFGGASGDGKGSEELYQQALSNPQRFASAAHADLADALPLLTLSTPSTTAAADAAVKVLSRNTSLREAARKPDVLVLTALPVELEATKLAFGISDHPQKTSYGTNVWMTDVYSQASGVALRVAVACLGYAGNVTAATVTTELASQLRPRRILMVGIAAGIRGKCKIGDVVLSERVAAYESAAIIAFSGLEYWWRRLRGASTAKNERRPEMYRITHAMEQDIVAYLAPIDSLSTRLTETVKAMGALTTPDSASLKVRPRLATVASGEKLLRDPSVLAGLRTEMHGRIEIGEMEAVGIAEACRRLSTDFLIIRGVSDFGDTKKTDGGHQIASNAAAATCADFVRAGLILE